MASFAYTAINARGLEVDGVIAANDLGQAREQLQRRGLLAERISEMDTSASLGEKRISLGRGVKAKSLQIFSRQFATMIEAGLSVVQALVVLEDQTSDVALAEVVTQLRYDVEAGLILSEAMARHPKVFSRLYVAMVEAGEAAGILDIVLDRVATQIEKQEAIKRRVKGAMIYPALVFTFAVLVLTAMLLFLIPIFVKIFAQLHGNLPMLTKLVVHASNGVRGYWYVIFPLLFASPFVFRWWKGTESGRRKWDTFLLRIPMRIGETARKVTMARFSRTLATLVAAGVDIIKALEITGSAAGNWVVESALVKVRESVHAGEGLSQPLAENDVFPPMVAQMMKIGEESGELQKMLDKIADFYEDEVDAAVASLTAIIEPMMMIFVGAIVGVIVISMYLPMFKMYQLIAH
ncbi:MAG TPA: type II secretion system F family protein [Gaiellaceae bacterium]|nr:type II secretion system F family protein [Gaiellaceae bacterium]